VVNHHAGVAQHGQRGLADRGHFAVREDRHTRVSHGGRPTSAGHLPIRPSPTQESAAAGCMVPHQRSEPSQCREGRGRAFRRQAVPERPEAV
jgi:hypothetical protein